MSIYVALLRGVNVGGNNMVSMKDLKAKMSKSGFEDVSTYINSGNVLFKSDEKDARRLEKKVEAILAKDFGIENKVVIRSLAEMAKLIKKIDSVWKEQDDWRYNVMFLRHAVDSKDVVKQFGAKPDIEEVTYTPGTLLWSAPVATIASTTMQKLSAKPLFKEMTVRNLNTTRKLFSLMQAMENE